MTENALLPEILLALSREGHRLFRNNVGTGWAGSKAEFAGAVKSVKLYPGDVVIRQGRPLHAGLCKGSADLIGLTRDGLFCSVEVKHGSTKTTAEQTAWAEMVAKMGGRAGIVRSVEEALRMAGGKNG